MEKVLPSPMVKVPEFLRRLQLVERIHRRIHRRLNRLKVARVVAVQVLSLVSVSVLVWDLALEVVLTH